MPFRADQEEDTTTTPFDMIVLTNLDRFHLVINAIERVPQLKKTGAHVAQKMRDKLIEHKEYINEFGGDLLEIRDWKWTN